MKIALNITPAMRQTTGIGTYAKELTRSLLELDGENNYLLFFSKSPFSQTSRFDTHFIKDNDKIKTKAINLPYKVLNFLWNELGVFPIENFSCACDVFHSLDMLAPFAKDAKILTTVHDINWLIFDDNPVFKKRLLYKEVSRSLTRSKIIITDSAFTKLELLKYFPSLNENKIEIVPLGVSDRFKPLDRVVIEEKRKIYGWGDFILYIGALDQSRKNLIRLVKAYAALKKRIKEKLVLCGRITNGSKPLLELIHTLKLNDDVVIYHKWIEEDEVPILYNMSKLFVYPSLYEGFGLPVLESMACGKPIITSDISPLKEIASDAAILIDPMDQKGLSDSIEMLLTDDKLYNEMVERSLKRSKEFTWTRTAKETLKLYEKCAAG